MATPNKRNWLLGRPLVFGDVKQIKELQRLNAAHAEERVIDLASPHTVTSVTCPCCKGIFDAAPQLIAENNS